MRRLGMITLIILAPLLFLTACGSSERSVRQTVEMAAKAAEDDLNRRTMVAVEPFFVSSDEGGNPDGLQATREALQAFAASLGDGDQVQFHRFEVPAIEVHERAGLARASYRLHLSVVRGGQVMFRAVVTQNVALRLTSRGWRIMGGDQPQVSEVVGQLPAGKATIRR